MPRHIITKMLNKKTFKKILKSVFLNYIQEKKDSKNHGFLTKKTHGGQKTIENHI